MNNIISKNHLGHLKIGFLISSLVLLSSCSSLFKETIIKQASCGQTLSASFSENFEFQDFTIELSAGQKISAEVTPVGDYLLTALELYEPAGDRIIFQQETQKLPSFESETLSATGSYKIRVRNFRQYSDDRIDYKEKGRAGDYSLQLSCN